MADMGNIEEMAKKIEVLKRTAMQLKEVSGGIQAVDRNVNRILATIKVLEINISDLVGLV